MPAKLPSREYLAVCLVYACLNLTYREVEGYTPAFLAETIDHSTFGKNFKRLRPSHIKLVLGLLRKRGNFRRDREPLRRPHEVQTRSDEGALLLTIFVSDVNVVELTRQLKVGWVCAGLLVLAVSMSALPFASASPEVKVIQLDNVWLQEIRVRVEGGTWEGVGYSGIAKSWGYDNLGGGIYDDFSWFEEGAYVVEGEHVVVLVDRQELDFWAEGEWCLLGRENIVRRFGPWIREWPVAYYSEPVEYYLEKMENSVFYLDQAYLILQDLFNDVPDPFFTNDIGRLCILHILTKPLAGGFADYPITVRAGGWMEPEPATPVLSYEAHFHEIGHTFTGGGRHSYEWWAEFCSEYVFDNFEVNIYKNGALEKLAIYEQLGAPFENAARDLIQTDEDLILMGEIMRGILFVLGENLGYDKFENVRYGYVGVKSVRDDTINLMYQLYPAFGDEMWPYFENWNFPVDEDTDNDGLTNRQEIGLGLNTFLFYDWDEDGLSDGEEIALGTDPKDRDTDNDYLEDGDETKLHGTDPFDNDSDDDGLTDHFEIEMSHTNPLLYDSDDDGVSDYDEVYGSAAQPGRGLQWHRLDYIFWLIFYGIVIAFVVTALVLKVRRR
jgi:hypothetical protein